MAVETNGMVAMAGETDSGAHVRVRVGDGRLILTAGDEEVGNWLVDELGVHAVPEGFVFRAEGEEFLLKTSDDVAIAEEIGLAAATPRLARRLAASHNPEPRPLEEPVKILSTENRHVAAVAFALAGVMVLLGGVFLRTSPDFASESVTTSSDGGAEFWLWFVVGGLLMVAAGFVVSIGVPRSRLIAMVVLVAVLVLFGFVATKAIIDPSFLTAYGFISGGIVVGVAVLFAGSLQDDS